MSHLDQVDFAGYTTAAGAAKAAHKALRKDCVEWGQDPDFEVFIYSPEQSKERGYTQGWQVVWECGPDNWGIRFISGPWGFCETYWGFDLTFCEERIS